MVRARMPPRRFARQAEKGRQTLSQPRVSMRRGQRCERFALRRRKRAGESCDITYVQANGTRKRTFSKALNDSNAREGDRGSIRIILTF